MVFMHATDEKNEIPADFTCFVCQSLVFEPMCCGECFGVLVCQSCIQKDG